MGSDKEDGVGPGRLSGQGCKNVNRETNSLREGWAVVLPVPGGGDEEGRDRAYSDIDPPEAEAEETDPGTKALTDLESEADDNTPDGTVRGTVEEEYLGESSSSGSEWIGVDRSGSEWIGVERSGAEWSGVEQSGAEWSGVERGGGLTPSGGDLKQVQCSAF